MAIKCIFNRFICHELIDWRCRQLFSIFTDASKIRCKNNMIDIYFVSHYQSLSKIIYRRLSVSKIQFRRTFLSYQLLWFINASLRFFSRLLPTVMYPFYPFLSKHYIFLCWFQKMTFIKFMRLYVVLGVKPYLFFFETT